MQTIIDKSKVLANRKRAEHINDSGADYLLRRVVADLQDRLLVQNRRFDNTVLIGIANPAVDEAIGASGKVGQISRIDPATIGEDEDLGLGDEGHDLVISLLHLHEANDVPGLLAQMRRALRPDGLLIACIPGQDTLRELRVSLMQAEMDVTGGASPRVLPFLDVRAAGGLLQRAGFALPVADIDSVSVRHASLFDLARDLRAMGATNSLSERTRMATRRDVFFRAASLYAAEFGDPDGRISSTFSFVWLSGWAPSETQQKPLKPGSATMRLADVLKDRSG